MTDHAKIWLQPWCEGCERHSYSGDGRQWCQDDAWDKCDECGQLSAMYIRADVLAVAIDAIERKVMAAVATESNACQKRTYAAIRAARDALKNQEQPYECTCSECVDKIAGGEKKS